MIGKISKQWTGFVREAFTDFSSFDIHFPLDLDVKMKAVMIGACFLIVSLFLLIFGISLVSFCKDSVNYTFLSDLLKFIGFIQGVPFNPRSEIPLSPDSLDSQGTSFLGNSV